MTTWDSPATDIRADLEAAIKLIEEAPFPAPCGHSDHPHLVHPRASGLTRCACCGCVVAVAGLKP